MIENAVIFPIGGSKLCWVNETPLIFVESQQQVFGASAFTASIWKRLSQGISVGDFLDAAEDYGCDGQEALFALLDMSIADILSLDGNDVAVTNQMFLDLGVCTIRLSFSGDQSLGMLRSMFAHIECDPKAFDEHLVLIDHGEDIDVGPVDETMDRFNQKDVGAAVKAVITDFAHQQSTGVLLHAATLADDDEAVLIVGDPGAGKSTLSVALGVSGFILEGDDITTLHDDGQVSAVPFPATLKRGSVPLIAPLVPDILNRPENLRLDDQYARYLPLSVKGPPARRKVRCVLSLQRDDKKSAGLQILEPDQCIASLIHGAWTSNKRMTAMQFNALVTCIDGAVAYQLTYHDLNTGVVLAKEAWENAGLNKRTSVQQTG